jgi:hypothetical protein
MADLSRKTDGPSPLSKEGYDESLLPDFNRQFVTEEDLQAFAQALSAPDPSPSSDDLLNGLTPNSPTAASRTSLQSLSRSQTQLLSPSQQSLFITAHNDWAPVNTRIKSTRRKSEKKKRRPPRRSRDETREGYLYSLLKWPLLAVVGAWVAGLGISYLWTRLYIWLYEHFVAWRGKREKIRKKLHAATHYADWVKYAKEMDTFLGNDTWKTEDEYAYYDHKTVRRVLDQIRKQRRRAEAAENLRTTRNGSADSVADRTKPIEELKSLIEACVKNNFVGVENSRLYSQTYYGTKNLVQEFNDESKLIDSLTICSSAKDYIPESSENADSLQLRKALSY